MGLDEHFVLAEGSLSKRGSLTAVRGRDVLIAPFCIPLLLTAVIDHRVDYRLCAVQRPVGSADLIAGGPFRLVCIPLYQPR